MRINTSWKKIIPFMILLGLLSCVTVNIYFPAEEVRKTAEEIVGEVRGQSETTGPQSFLFNQLFMLSGFFAPSEAHAQAETAVSNAAIRAVKERLKQRAPQLAPFFDQGVIGEGNNGYVRIIELGSLDMKQKAAVNRLVEAENRDRKQLYQEIVRAMNLDSSQLSRVESIFASEWQQTARPGWKIEKAPGQWVKK
ncbi:MAG: YdbL family protein [Desulfoferrobacter sp.]